MLKSSEGRDSYQAQQRADEGPVAPQFDHIESATDSDSELTEAAFSGLEEEEGGASTAREAELTEEEVLDLSAVGDTAELWQHFKAVESPELHARIVERYLPFVRSLAERTHKSLPHSVDANDLVQDGTLGLLDAIASFNLSHGVRFETFAGRRIKGAMLDGIRSMDWVPRLDRVRQSLFHKARERLFQRSGKEPDDVQIAAELGVKPEIFEKFRSAVRYGVNHKNAGDLRRPAGSREGDEDVSLDDVAPIEQNRDQGLTILREAIQELLKVAVPDARQLMELMLYEGLNLREAGQFLGISESRASQLVSKMMGDFAERLRDAGSLPPGSVLRCLREEYGEVRGLERSDLESLPTEVLEALGTVNSAAPVQFELTGGEEAFVDTTTESEFDRLMNTVSRHEDVSRPNPAPEEGGFTFFDAPEDNDN